ncbi:MAG: glycosyltransferase [Deltaproteobacteria bacterium]|nr:glycosyltransferase [Deltaproteobacteria bacterium]
MYTLEMSPTRISIGKLIKLYRLICEIKADVIQTWMYHADLVGGVVARIAGKKNVVWGVRASNLVSQNHRMTFFVRWLCARLSHIVPDKIITNSRAAVAIHASLGYNERKMEVVYNGFDLDVLKPDPLAGAQIRSELGVDSNGFLLGMVARWDPHKDHSNLFTALSLLCRSGFYDWTCVLVGSDMTEQNEVLMNLLVKHGVREKIILLGPRQDIGSVMNALDVHVLSSVSEAFPNVVAEAMACEIPCIVTDVGDSACLVGETGWVVPHSDPLALSEALASAMTLLKEPAARSERKRISRERVFENFSLSRMLCCYSDIWGKTLSGSGRKS